MEYGMEWNMEWNKMEWNGMEWNGMEWNGMEYKKEEIWNEMDGNGMGYGMERKKECNGMHVMKCNGIWKEGMEYAMEWNGMERNGFG
ncbi:hypothetical protein H8958_015591 [Nasalis larvatus]